MIDPLRGKDLAEQPDTSDTDQMTSGGEFRFRPLEETFGSMRLGDTVAFCRRVLIASVILNMLFFISDWRFHGTPQFRIAIPARILVVLASLGCAVVIGFVRTPRALHHVMAVWLAMTGFAVAALVTSHSELALFVVLLLPMIFYLAVPLPFAWTLTGGGLTSVALLIGYQMRSGLPGSGLGLALALLTLNCCLALVVRQSNALRRREWQATRKARRIADELSANRESLERMFSAAPVPMVVTSVEDGVILHVNEACATMFGISPAMIGHESFLRYYADPSERERLVRRLERDGRVSDFETEALCADGARRTMMVKAASVELAGGRALIAGLIDISDRKAVELSLEWLASTDPLTRLPNRLSFFSSARAEMMRARRLDRPLSLLMIDLDHFKAVNDTFGHLGGDTALKAFGVLCTERLRSIDITGRLGGEEFGVLLPDTDGGRACDMADVFRAELERLRLPPPYESLRLTASIGVAMVRPGDKDLDVAIARADIALYAAKRDGRNRVHCDMADLEPAERHVAG